MILSILMFINLFSKHAIASEDPSVVYKNNKAISTFTDEKVMESKMQLEKEVVDHPDSGALHYNLGFVHENSKEPESAIKEYLSSVKNTDDKNLQFQANFNAARLYGEQKDIPNALKYYQAALEIKPDSQEVKTNIEMLFKGNGGGGESSDKDKKSDQQNKKDQKQQQPQPQQPDKPKDSPQKKPAPKPFKSQDLNEQDVRKILDELKRQEEQIRAKMNNQKSKESPVDKDW